MKKTEKPGTYGLKKNRIKPGKKPGEKLLISFRKVLVKPTSWLNWKHGEKSENRGNRENREKPLKNWLIRLLKVLVKPTSWLNGKKQGEIRKPGKTGKNREDRKPGKTGKSSQSYKVFDVFFRFNAIYTNIAKKPIVID